MSTLGFDAVGRLAISQIGQNFAIANGNLTQASGVGMAGAVTGNPNALFIGASGIGLANALAQDIASKNIPQASAVGAAGLLISSLSQQAVIAAAVGSAGNFTFAEQKFLLQAAGVGVAGSVVGQNTTPLLPQAIGVGTANAIGISGSLLPAICAGIAGVIAAVLSGGGGSKYKPEYGLEPIKPRPKPPAPPKPKVVLPPSLGIVALPIAPRETSPIDGIEYAHHDLRSLEAQIMEAKRATDRQRQDDAERHRQDEADIADVKAILELLD